MVVVVQVRCQLVARWSGGDHIWSLVALHVGG